MFGFFNNSKINKEIEILEVKVKVDSLKQWVVDVANKTASVIQAMDDEIIDYGERLKKMEELVNITQIPEEELGITEAIIRFLDNNKKTLHLDEIFDNVKKYNLKNKNITRNSFKASLYSLARQGRIGYGENPSTFKKNH